MWLDCCILGTTCKNYFSNYIRYTVDDTIYLKTITWSMSFSRKNKVISILYFQQNVCKEVQVAGNMVGHGRWKGFHDASMLKTHWRNCIRKRSIQSQSTQLWRDLGAKLYKGSWRKNKNIKRVKVLLRTK